MRFSSPFLGACLALVSVALSSSFKLLEVADTNSTDLRQKNIATKSVVSVNETDLSASSFHSDGDIAWPDTAVSSILQLPSLNASILSPELGAPSIRCNGKAYGRNLKLTSCLQALNKVPQSTGPMVLGQRGKGEWDGVLPYRIMSSDGLCAIDISHKAGILSDSIIPSDLRQSVKLVIDVCVRGNPNEGGVVGNIGKDGNLAVRVMPYKPNVRCGRAIPTSLIRDCKLILDQMQTSETEEVFGQKGDEDPSITIKLPATLTGAAGRCQVFIDTLVPGQGQDTYNMYKIWAAATAIEHMCIYKSQNGIALRLGMIVTVL